MVSKCILYAYIERTLNYIYPVIPNMKALKLTVQKYKNISIETRWNGFAYETIKALKCKTPN